MKLVKKISLFILVTTLFSSCLNNVDINQAEDLTLSPVFDGSLIYFTVKPTDFVVNGVTLDTVSDITRFTIFKDNPIVRDNLVKIDVDVVIRNKFNRQFKVQFDFLDDNDNLTYQFQELVIGANDRGFKQSETVIIRDNPLFLSTQKMKVTIILPPSNTPFNPDENVSLVFKSGGRFYLNF